MADVIVDERGVSPVFGYVLTLGISTLLISGLIVATGGYVDDQRERTSRSELRVIGQQVSADIAAADRLNRTEGASDVVVQRKLPEGVVGSEYVVRLVNNTNGPTQPYLRLTTAQPDVTAEVGVTTQTAVINSSAGGGDIKIRVKSGGIEVTNG